MIVVEGQKSFRVAGSAQIITDDRELAWAEKLVRKDEDIKWILGNFVEADRPNDNGHIFPLEDLKAQLPTIAPKPLNMLHHPNRIVGCVTAAELLYPAGGTPALVMPTAAAATMAGGVSGSTTLQILGGGGQSHYNLNVTAAAANPYVEALSAFWRNFFPEEYLAVSAAHSEGSLFYSMECVPESLTCPVDNLSFAYRGCHDTSYCDHLNAPRSPKRLNRPHFNASALILPPVQPGWRGADIVSVADLLSLEPAAAQSLYNDVADTAGHLEVREWEAAMASLLDLVAADAERSIARSYSAEERRKLASVGKAMPDGSFPIVNEADLRNAIQAFGRAPEEKRAAVKRYIRKRAKALGKENLLPEGWS